MTRGGEGTNYAGPLPPPAPRSNPSSVPGVRGCVVLMLLLFFVAPTFVFFFPPLVFYNFFSPSELSLALTHTMISADDCSSRAAVQFVENMVR